MGWGVILIEEEGVNRALQTLSSLPEEQQMDENVEALAHSPIEIIQIGEGKMEKETQEEDEKNEKVRGERKRP